MISFYFIHLKVGFVSSLPIYVAGTMIKAKKLHLAGKRFRLMRLALKARIIIAQGNALGEVIRFD